MTLLFDTAADAQIPTLGASGAMAAVLGAYLVLIPAHASSRSCSNILAGTDLRRS